MPFDARFIGRLGYDVALDMQREAVARVAAGGAGIVFGLEHDPVITLGRHMRGRDERATGVLRPDEITGLPDLPLGPLYAARGIAVVQSDRGGQATYHGPGQLVVYPILPLARRNIGVRAYVAMLNAACLALTGEYGIEGAYYDEADPGVYVATDGAPRPKGDGVKRKLVSVGVHVTHGVSKHGIAVNVAVDLTPFSWFIACGQPQTAFVNLVELGGPSDLRAVFNAWIAKFSAAWSDAARSA